MAAEGTTRSEFQQLAELRFVEARALANAQLFDGACYLAGYSVECALKAVIAHKIRADVLPPKGQIDKVYTHELGKLLDLAGLKDDLKSAVGVLPSWTVVSAWSESRRYLLGASASEADALLNSIEDPKIGVLPWLRQRW